jgi:hypothetical protein
MKKRVSILYIAAIIAITMFSCKQRTAEMQIVKNTIKFESVDMKSYADTIVCDMVVKNPDKEDLLTEQWLGQLKRKELTDSIFADIYSGQLIATDFETHKVLTTAEIKRIEETPGYNREIVGKYQFRESWFYDKKQHVFIKKVQSIIFGYETYDERGFVKGYKPLFRVEF